MTEAYLVGIGGTQVGRFPERSFMDLTAEAIEALIHDAGSDCMAEVTHAWFGNVLMDFWGQRALRGQEVLTPLVDQGCLPAGVSVVNVEAGCATGSAAFNGAFKHVLSGEGDVALAVGVEKMNKAGAQRTEILTWMDGAGGVLDPEYYYAPFHELAAELKTSFATGEGRSMGMDIYALWAKWHMATYGTTVEQIASAAAKNHTNAVDNPRAQYRFPMTVEEVLADRMVSEPLTRAMCAPTGDAAAAALVCSEAFLRKQPAAVRERAIRIRGHAIAGGIRKAGFEDDRAPIRAARRAYEMAGVKPADLDLVELHDATSYAEVVLVEDLGLCARGEGGPFTASGATARDGRLPVNPSGGLVSRGHPIGATGLLMLQELVIQLRGEGAAIQIPNARIGLAENGGGILGHDAAVSSVTILEAPAAA